MKGVTYDLELTQMAFHLPRTCQWVYLNKSPFYLEEQGHNVAQQENISDLK